MDRTTLRIATVSNPGNVHVRRWVDEMRGRGHDVRVFAPPALIDSTMPDVIPIGRAGLKGPLSTVDRVLGLRRALKAYSPDVLHAHWALNFGTWAALTRVKPFVLTSLGSDLLTAPGRGAVARWKVKTALKGADRLVVNSSALAAAAVRLGFDGDRISTIVYGVDTSAFAPPAAREGVGFTVLSTRRLEPLYRVDDVICALAALRGRREDARLVVASWGSEEDRLRRLADELGLADAVRFTGRVPDAELAGLLQQADVYVQAPESDASSVSLFEAMSCGLPVVASDLPGPREWVDTDGGLFFPVGDVDALAQVLAVLAEDPRLRAAMGRRNRDFAVARLDWHSEMDAMERLLLDLAASKGGTDS